MGVCVCVCGETAVSMWVCVATVVCGCRWKQVYVCRYGFVPVCVYGGESGRIGVERRTEYGVSFWGDENVLELEVMAAQHCECAQCH